jgi:tetraacyldisaccharide 4'-kinase
MLSASGIEAGMNILLTDYDNLFTRDWYLPTGDLRDVQASYRRAHCIVVTKCRPTWQRRRWHLYKRRSIHSHTSSYIYGCYSDLSLITDKHRLILSEEMEVLLVSGIANPRLLKIRRMLRVLL